MFRYIAIVWNINHAPECATTELAKQRLLDQKVPWTVTYDRPGLFVAYVPAICGANRAYLLHHLSGAALGTLFHTSRTDSQPSHPVTLDDLASTQRLVITEGRSMIEDYWGSYILFLTNGDRSKTHVLRGPMSSLACFHTQVRGVHLLYSVVDDCVALGLSTYSIDWSYVCAQATSGDCLGPQTAINEIGSLECGECLEIARNGVQRKTFWNPCAIAASDEIEHFDNAASLLRATTELCVSEWASAHADILHTLSGGIDSSIVLSCLAHAPRKPHITCVNLYSRGGAGDERTFARIMAQHASVDLREIERDAQIDLSSFLECARTARPVLNFSAVDAEPVTRRLAYELGATAVFNGELGDNVFGRAAARQAVAEYLWQWGFRSTVLDIALDVAIQRRLSISSVLWRGLRDAAAHRLQRDWSVHRYAKRSGVYESRRQGLVSERFLDEYERHLERFIHPWFRDVRKVPPGRLPLIYAIAVVTSTFYHSPFGKPSDPPMIAPLASQPLAQLALRIPTHFHIIGGMSRAVALRAFSDSLPEAILSRDGKGTPESWIGDLVQRNRDFLREFLLDGQLAKQGILDREKTSALLSNRLGKSQVEPHQLIVQLYIEAWLSRWSGIEVRAAA